MCIESGSLIVEFKNGYYEKDLHGGQSLEWVRVRWVKNNYLRT